MRNPLSLEAFADWCARKPADGEYDWADTNGCAFCQYLTSVGLPIRRVDIYSWVDEHWRTHPLPEGVAGAVAQYPWTFGALSSRLRAASTSGRT